MMAASFRRALSPRAPTSPCRAPTRLALAAQALRCLCLAACCSLSLAAASPADSATNAAAEQEAAPAADALADWPQMPTAQASEPIGEIFKLQPVMVNLDGGGFVKIVLGLEQNIPQLRAELEAKNILLIDATITWLSARRVDELNTPRGILHAKRQLREKFNAFLGDGFIKHVYFIDFMLR